MNTINRLNTAISNHNMVANVVALGLLASIVITTASVINFSGNLARTAYDIPQTSVQTQEKPTVAAPATTHPSTITVSAPRISVNGEQPDMVGYLQPANGLRFNTSVTAETLQPNTNTVQVTGTGIQNAEAVLQ